VEKLSRSSRAVNIIMVLICNFLVIHFAGSKRFDVAASRNPVSGGVWRTREHIHISRFNIPNTSASLSLAAEGTERARRGRHQAERERRDRSPHRARPTRRDVLGGGAEQRREHEAADRLRTAAHGGTPGISAAPIPASSSTEGADTRRRSANVTTTARVNGQATTVPASRIRAHPSGTHGPRAVSWRGGPGGPEFPAQRDALYATRVKALAVEPRSEAARSPSPEAAACARSGSRASGRAARSIRCAAWSCRQ